MIPPDSSYGTHRQRPATVSFIEVGETARRLMTEGEYPSVAAVRERLGRGSQTTISDAMRRFWKDQSALNAGNPVALTRLPPEFADAAVELWKQALRLSLQTAKLDDNAARARFEELQRNVEGRSRSIELREKEWDMAARVRERALTDTREQVNMLLKQLSEATHDIRARDIRIADLESQLEEHRSQLATVIARAVSRSRKSGLSHAVRPSRARAKKTALSRTGKNVSINRKPAKSKRKGRGKRR